MKNHVKERDVPAGSAVPRSVSEISNLERRINKLRRVRGLLLIDSALNKFYLQHIPSLIIIMPFIASPIIS